MVRIVQCGVCCKIPSEEFGFIERGRYNLGPVDDSGNRGFATVKNCIGYPPEFPRPKELIRDLSLDGFCIAYFGFPKQFCGIRYVPCGSQLMFLHFCFNGTCGKSGSDGL